MYVMRADESRIRRPLLADLAFERLADDIVRGRFLPGSALCADELASELRISRAPVREAMNRLHSVGLVDIGSGGSALICRRPAADMQMRLRLAGELCDFALRAAQPSLQQRVAAFHEAICGTGDGVDDQLQLFVDLAEILLERGLGAVGGRGLVDLLVPLRIFFLGEVRSTYGTAAGVECNELLHRFFLAASQGEWEEARMVLGDCVDSIGQMLAGVTRPDSGSIGDRAEP